jgi:hypothetical protein
MSFTNDNAGSPAPPPLPVRNVSVSSFGSGATTESFQGVGRHGSTSSNNGVGRFGSSSNATGSRKMTSTVRASNKAAILAVGEELRQLLHAENPPLIKDRRYHLRTYQACFAGHEMVDWLLKKGEVESRREAVAMMQKLIDHGVLHHVCDDHVFKDDKLFYRFRKDDGTFEEPPNSAILARGQRIYGRLRSDGSDLIKDRKYHLTTYKSAFVAQEFVDWLISRGETSSRIEAVDIGKQLLDAGVFRHVCDDHHFKDEFLFFRFKNDDKPRSPLPKKNSRRNTKGGGGNSDDSGSVGEPSDNRQSGSSWGSGEDSTGQPPKQEIDEYVHMQRTPTQPSPLTNSTTSPTPEGAQVRRPTVEELMDPNGQYVKRQVDVVSDPVGYGFVIRGSRPVYVHAVDPNGPASAAGLKVT